MKSLVTQRSLEPAYQVIIARQVKVSMIGTKALLPNPIHQAFVACAIGISYRLQRRPEIFSEQTGMISIGHGHSAGKTCNRVHQLLKPEKMPEAALIA